MGAHVGGPYVSAGADGYQAMLFARSSTDDKAFRFLGPACYLRHTGERPMQIIWQLEHELPGDVFAELAAAAG